jgi:metal-responsive CopG/Arc/MetJ family transcriptional regulator
MGRPALYLIRVHTALSAETLDLLDERTGPKGRSEAIREAVKEWLEKPQDEKKNR